MVCRQAATSCEFPLDMSFFQEKDNVMDEKKNG
jgi:hypothetical protein